MTNAPSTRWPDTRPDARVSSEAELAEERLAFADRIIGLEEQVRELQAASRLTPTEAYPPPAALPEYPICKPKQFDNCRQRGG